MVFHEIFHRFVLPRTGSSTRNDSCTTTNTGSSSSVSTPYYCPTNDNNNKNFYDSPSILAFSVVRVQPQRLSVTHSLGADRRTLFTHLHPKVFFKNGFRIVVMQSTTVITNYYNDQLKYDIALEERVAQGKITRQEADREEEKWQETEWTLRLESIPRRIYVSFLKYHAVMLVTRLYERFASNYVTEETLDALTIDTFECAKVSAKIEEDRVSLLTTMFTTCWKANTISFLADYSVHQIILAYGYYVYVKEIRQRIKQGDNKDKVDDVNVLSLALSFIQKSSLLVLSRGVCLYFSSLGGAIGTVMWPGWGTLAGTNLGDSFSLSLVDDVKSPSIE